jgi:hypothetical protein
MQGVSSSSLLLDNIGQFTLTKGYPRNGERAYNNLTIASLPSPFSPDTTSLELPLPRVSMMAPMAVVLSSLNSGEVTVLSIPIFRLLRLEQQRQFPVAQCNS